MAAKSGAYFNRGATLFMEPAPDGRWVAFRVYEDAEGKVGTASIREDNTWYLSNHWASPLPTDAVKPPRWPRFPDGLEFGPEQQRQPSAQR